MRLLCAFDLDHTLVRSTLDLAAMKAEIRALAPRRGIALPPVSLGWTIAQTIEAMAAAEPAVEAACWAIALEHETAALDSAMCEPGARETVEALAAAGVPLAIWTNNARRATEIALERCGLRPFFRTLVTRDEAALKPDPAGLAVLRQAHPAHPVCMIGDSWVDGVAAQAGGAAFIAYRIRPEEIERRALAPRVVIHDLRALPEHLAALAGAPWPV
jgi:phosphoglycolate phosphatase